MPPFDLGEIIWKLEIFHSGSLLLQQLLRFRPRFLQSRPGFRPDGSLAECDLASFDGEWLSGDWCVVGQLEDPGEEFEVLDRAGVQT